jgi:hypothetical protein
MLTANRNLEDQCFFDPPLVFEGKKQALDVGEEGTSSGGILRKLENKLSSW